MTIYGGNHMRYIPIFQQARHTKAEAMQTATQAEKNAADIDYIAMMMDVELEEDDDSEVSDDE